MTVETIHRRIFSPDDRGPRGREYFESPRKRIVDAFARFFAATILPEPLLKLAGYPITDNGFATILRGPDSHTPVWYINTGERQDSDQRLLKRLLRKSGLDALPGLKNRKFSLIGAKHPSTDEYEEFKKQITEKDPIAQAYLATLTSSGVPWGVIGPWVMDRRITHVEKMQVETAYGKLATQAADLRILKSVARGVLKGSAY